MPYRCWLRGARQVVQIRADPLVEFIRGDKMRHIDVLTSNDCDLSILIDDNGRIVVVGRDEELSVLVHKHGVLRQISVYGKVLLPGLVDAHSHPVFAGDRVSEFAAKLAGTTYMEVHESGGGIHFTVEKTRLASEDQLYEDCLFVTRQMLRAGTTLLEAKTGYGLDWDTELKMLKVIDRIKEDQPIEISTTYCAAHAVPNDRTMIDQTDLIVDSFMPKLSLELASGRVKVENVDVFCEKGAFDLSSTHRILQAGKTLGLKPNFHGDELTPMGAAEFAVQVDAKAVSHLEWISDLGIDRLAESHTVAVVLPTTAYILRLKPPPVRTMLNRGVIVALGSDFNPNAYCLSMPMV